MKSLLSDNFYSVAGTDHDEANPEKLENRLCLNPEHSIFQGHFPGNPVVPGVCIVQMIKECLSAHFDKELILVKAEEIKFLNIINPEESPDITLEFRIRHTGDDLVHAQVTVTGPDKTFMKFRGSFR